MESRRSRNGQQLQRKASGRRKSRNASIDDTPPQSPMSPRSPKAGRRKSRNAAAPMTPPISPLGVHRPASHRRVSEKSQNMSPRSPLAARPRVASSDESHNSPRSPQPGRQKSSSNNSKRSPRAVLNRQRKTASERLQHGKRIPSTDTPQHSPVSPRAPLQRQNTQSSDRKSFSSRNLHDQSQSSLRPSPVQRPSLQSSSENADDGHIPSGSMRKEPGVKGRQKQRPVTVGFRVGQYVRLEKLKTSEMNSKEGYVYGISLDRVYVTIRDEFGVDYVAILPENLKVLAQPQKSTTKADGPDWDRFQLVIHEPKVKAPVTTDEAKHAAELMDAADDDESVTQIRAEVDSGEFETEGERLAAHTKIRKELEEQGLSPELLCDSADDAVSAITISDQTYVLDLYVQKENREQTRKQEVMEAAYKLYTIALKEGMKANESLFMGIFTKLSSEKAAIFKEQDAIADKRLENELNMLLEKQAAEAASNEEEEFDFAYDEEEMYPEIGQYEPVVRIPEVKQKQGEEKTKSKKVEENDATAPEGEGTTENRGEPKPKPDPQIRVDEMDTPCKCTCSIM